ncbi:hypothetical protein [Nostoc sp.]|uniref:hypothetical protein n=1 Tax=Nostoc sp. TaxID=1180 RepID=UPI002FF76152
MLTNSELTINQGSNLKLKVGEQRYEQFSRVEVLHDRTVGKPLDLNIVEQILIKMNSQI